MTDDNLRVLVVTHKNFDTSIIQPGYQVIKVGNNETDEKEMPGWLHDNSGDNISEKNPYYCELTAQYWEWKNGNPKTQYVGLVHYRRFFFDYKKQSKSFEEDILSEERIKEILAKKKAIMSFPTVKYAGYGTLYKNKPKEEQDINWVVIEEIIQSDYPEFRESFNKILYGKFTTWGNMVITTRELFDDYSEWMFEVLAKYDHQMEERGEVRVPRVDGFLTEYLLLVWFHKKLKREQIQYLEVRNTETDNFLDYKKGMKGSLLHQIRSNYFLLKTARYLRMGILLILRHP